MGGKVTLDIGALLILWLCAAVCVGCVEHGESRTGDALCREAEIFLADQREPEAMIAADDALCAPGAGDSVKGKAYMILSLCHTAAHNSASALSFAEMALACDPDNEDIQAVYADALIDGQRYGECVAFLDSVPEEYSKLRRRLIPALSGMGDWHRVVETTDSIGVDKLTDTELFHRAYSLARLGRLSPRASELRLLNLDDGYRGYTIEELHLLRDIYAACGDRQRAGEIERGLIAMQDSLIASMAESKIYEDVYNLENSRHREKEMRAHRSRVQLIMTTGAGILLALLSMVAVLVIRLRATRQRADAEKQLLILRDELKHRHEESREHEASLAEMSSRVDRLFRDHYEAIEMAANLLLDASLSKNSEKKITDSLGSIIDRCRAPKFLRSLEQTVNLYRDNVIDRLRSQMPELADSDMVIVLYAAAGLTPRVMCLLTGLSTSALYNRKYRLKKRIYTSGAADTSEFIRLIEG